MATVYKLDNKSKLKPKQVFLDTNFLINWFNAESPKHEECKSLIKRLGKLGTRFIIPTSVIEEFLWVVFDMNMEAKHGEEWRKKFKLGEISVSDISICLEEAEKFIWNIRKLRVVEVCPTCTRELVSEMLKSNLWPADALLVRVMKREQTKIIVTLDNDFKGCNDIIVLRS